MDRVVVGEDDSRALLEGGFEDVCLMVFSYSLDARAVEFREETPSRQVESLDDKQDQEEMRQIVDDVETMRSDNILPVRPSDVDSAS